MSDWTDGQISATAEFIADQIGGLIAPYGGLCEVVDDEDLMWRQAFQSSQKLMVYVTWGGDVPWGTFNLAGVTHRVVRQWILGIKRGRGYKETRGDTFSTTTSVPPFADVVGLVRDFVRTMLGISEDYGTDNVTVKKWSQGSQVMSGMLVTFSTQNDLPAIQFRSDYGPPYAIPVPPAPPSGAVLVGEAGETQLGEGGETQVPE
jgi:hypothetical protein